MQNKRETVQDVIRATVREKHHLGSGWFANVFAFPGEDLQPFVFRLAGGSPLFYDVGRLKKTTALVPPNVAWRGIRVGQPLLIGQKDGPLPGVTIHLREPGLSLARWDKQERATFVAGDDYPWTRTCMTRMEALLQGEAGLRKQNPIRRLFTQREALASRNVCTPDISPGNILFDAKAGGLGLVDQIGGQGDLRRSDWCRDIEDTAEYLQDFFLGGSRVSKERKGCVSEAGLALFERYDAQRAHVSALIRDAVRNANDIHRGKSPIMFDVERYVPAVQMVTLDASRATLVEALRRLEKEADAASVAR